MSPTVSSSTSWPPRRRARPREASVLAREAQADTRKLQRALGQAQRQAETEQAARVKALAHTKARTAKAEGFFPERQTVLLELRARAGADETETERLERELTVAERQRVAAATSAQSSQAKISPLETALAESRQTLARRDEQLGLLGTAKQRGAQAAPGATSTSRAPTAAHGQLEEELRKAKVQIGTLTSNLKDMAAAANRTRKQSTARAAAWADRRRVLIVHNYEQNPIRATPLRDY